MLGAPDVLAEAGALILPPALAAKLEAETAAGRRVVAFGETGEALPRNPGNEAAPRLAPLALLVLEETLRPDAAETIAYMRDQEVDLKLISGDAAATVTAVAYAVGVPEDAGVVLIYVESDSAEYWDTPGGRVASVFSFVKAKATGEPFDGNEVKKLEL